MPPGVADNLADADALRVAIAADLGVEVPISTLARSRLSTGVGPALQPAEDYQRLAEGLPALVPKRPAAGLRQRFKPQRHRPHQCGSGSR